MKRIMYIFGISILIGVALGSIYLLWVLLDTSQEAKNLEEHIGVSMIIRDSTILDLLSIEPIRDLSDIESNLAATDLRNIVVPFAQAQE